MDCFRVRARVLDNLTDTSRLQFLTIAVARLVALPDTGNWRMGTSPVTALIRNWQKYIFRKQTSDRGLTWWHAQNPLPGADQSRNAFADLLDGTNCGIRVHDFVAGLVRKQVGPTSIQ